MGKTIYSPGKLAFHPEKLRALEAGEVSAPVTVRFKPTNRCNHNCYYCSYSPDVGYILSELINLQDEMPREKLLETLDSFAEIGVKAITYSGGGEPLMHPDIVGALERTRTNGLEFAMITNGQLIEGQRAKALTQAEWVRVSANAADAKTFARIRRMPERLFYTLEENLRNFARIRKPGSELGSDIVICEENYQQAFDIAAYLKKLGFTNVKFSPRWLPEGFRKYHTPLRDAVNAQIRRAVAELQNDGFRVYDKYEEHFSVQGVKQRLYSRCFMMEVTPVVAADCNVYLCHDKAYARSGLLGSIKDRSFKDLWLSPETAEFFRKFKPQESCRHHCSLDHRNLAIGEMLGHLDQIEQFRSGDLKHINFA
jgi:MoaA/NifB/PqqE/SkfB family radical SAM enzyme